MKRRNTRYWKDPTFIVSVMLAITGTVQASQGLLTELVVRYPMAFGLSMTAISCVTAVLTVVKMQIIDVRIPKLPENPQ